MQLSIRYKCIYTVDGSEVWVGMPVLYEEQLALLHEKVRSASDVDLCDMLQYTSPSFTDKEGNPLSDDVLNNVTKLYSNVDKPVSFYREGGLFAGSLSSRHSRAPGDMRVVAGRMLEANPALQQAISELYSPSYVSDIGKPFFQRVFADYGDDSIARMVDFGISFEDVSLLEAMHLLHHRTLFGIEKSTRYKPYHQRDKDGNFRYIIDPLVHEADMVEDVKEVSDQLFGLYSATLDETSSVYEAIQTYLTTEALPYDMFADAVQETLRGRQESLASSDELQGAYDKTIAALLKDSVRHLLPLNAKTSLSLQLNAEAMRHLIYNHQALPLGEAAVIQEFIRREGEELAGPLLDRTDPADSRSQQYQRFLSHTRSPVFTHRGVGEYELLQSHKDSDLGVTIEDYGDFIRVADPAAHLEAEIRIKGNKDDVVQSILRERQSDLQLSDALAAVDSMEEIKKDAIILDYAGIQPEGEDLRTNRRHRPGRAFENMRFDLSLIMPIGEIRDLRRHTPQTYLDPRYFTPEHDYYLSPVLAEAGVGEEVDTVMRHIDHTWERLCEEINPSVASTVLSLAHRAPMNTEVNARNLFHMTELRTQRGGAPLYAQIMRMVAAGQRYLEPLFDEMQTFVNYGSEVDYGRAVQEIRSMRKRQQS